MNGKDVRRMKSVLKKIFSGLKKLGVKLRATGSNYWLGFIPVIVCFLLKVPNQIVIITICAFGIWLILCIASLIPDGWLVNTEKEGKLTEAQERIKQLETELSEAQQKLSQEQNNFQSLDQQFKSIRDSILKQLCLRITDRLRSLRFDTAYWDFISLEPLDVLLSHQTVRIKLSNAEDYYAAEVKFEESGEMNFTLLENLSKDDESDSAKTSDRAISNILEPDASDELKNWMYKHLDGIKDLGYDAHCKGRRDFTLVNDLPEKRFWPMLCGLLEQEGYRYAKVSGNGIELGIGMNTKVA